MSWSAYEVFSVLSGVVLLVAGLIGIGTDDFKDRVWAVLGGLCIIGYGIFVAAQDSGTYYFPAVIFVIPFVAAGWLIYRTFFAEPESKYEGQSPEPPLADPSPSEDRLHVVLKDPAPARCKQCGSVLPDRARYCGSCGTAVNG